MYWANLTCSLLWSPFCIPWGLCFSKSYTTRKFVSLKGTTGLFSVFPRHGGSEVLANQNIRSPICRLADQKLVQAWCTIFPDSFFICHHYISTWSFYPHQEAGNCQKDKQQIRKVPYLHAPEDLRCGRGLILLYVSLIAGSFVPIGDCFLPMSHGIIIDI